MKYLRLCRFPTVFTALADIAAGFLLSHAALAPIEELLFLLAASACLYLSGMVFNDVFDVKQDTAERPTRPIPAGDVSLKQAVIFGTLLMLSGLGFAFLADLRSLLIASALAVCILLYDGLMKRTVAGPIFMGACRSLNLILGASTAGIRLAGAFQQPLLWVAGCMGIYIAGVTWFARREAKENLRLPLLLSAIVINVGLVGLAIWLGDFAQQLKINLPPGIANSKTMLILWGVIALTINRRLLTAIYNPTPARIQPAIGVMLLSVIVLDAAFVYFKFGNEGIPFVVGILLLLVPAITLRKLIPLT